MAKRKEYSDDFKQQAVQLALQNGFTKTAKELGVATSNLHRWNAEFTNKPTPEQIQARNEAEENKQLKEEIKRLKVENEILKKATAYFAREHL